MNASVENVPPLWERYTRESGPVHLTGLQALIRISLDQLRRDRLNGLRVGAFYSGYPGSPLAGLDQTLLRLRELLDREDVRLVPGLNEELAAGAVCGTQMLDQFPHSGYDGVLGLWFGKAPGLDRAIDVIRHSNFIGISRHGGALALVADDPMCKSSSLPSHSETALAHAYVPTLYPADAAEVLELGRYAFALSRYSGLWTALKIVPDVADGGSIFDVREDAAPPKLPDFEIDGQPFAKRIETYLLAPRVNRVEEEVIYHRLEAARRFAHANGLNPIDGHQGSERIGIVAAGRLYRELVSALDRLGLDQRERARLGLRLLRVQLLYPLDSRRIQEFAEGLEEVIVLDERRGFLETHLRAELCNSRSRPRVLGQYDAQGKPWLARNTDVRSEVIARDLAEYLSRRLSRPDLALSRPDLAERARQIPHPFALRVERLEPGRKPHFCSGCPHTRSTQVPEGSLAGGGIGCHTLALLQGDGVQFINAMGSEGSQWIGLSHYVDPRHIFQNIGDGTYFHSGRLALRACVEAGVTITYRILYNGVIAMTGGQTPVGLKSAAELVRELLAEGVARVIAVSSDSELLELARKEAKLELIPREDYEEGLRHLREQPGVTVVLFDQVCSNQKARMEKRGILPRRNERIAIQRDVCEGCGDCGTRSSCLSLWPVQTALGRKTEVHETSCTDDRSCLDGECPAFISLEIQEAPSTRALPFDRDSIPPPPRATLDGHRFEILTAGIGSTGVVTLNAILLRAAEYDGLHALHLDQTGLAQRGGRVTSHCILSTEPISGSARVGWGSADVCFALDPLSTNEPDSLICIDAQRTHTLVLEALAPTAPEVSDPKVRGRSLEMLCDQLDRCSRSLFRLRGGELTEAVLGSARAANVALLGAALQLGLLPLTLASLEATIRDSGISVAENLAALHLGRAVAHDPDLVEGLLADSRAPSIGDAGSPEAAEQLLGSDWSHLAASLRACGPGREVTRSIEICAAFACDLVDYQHAAYARAYLHTLSRVHRAELRAKPGSLRLFGIACRELYRVMAYKDEYEVARLLLRGPYRRWLEARFEGRPRMHYYLEPPLLRKLGLAKKVRIGRAAADPMFSLLYRLRGLRGRLADPFRWLRARRLERELIGWYVELLERLGKVVSPANLDACAALAERVSEIRGFERVKEERAQAVRLQVQDELAKLS